MAGRSSTEPDAQEENEVTRPSDLGFPAAQIEVEPVRQPLQEDGEGRVQIRMAQSIEEFTYGNPHVSYKLEAGKIYQMPAPIARYLDSLGYVFHTM